MLNINRKDVKESEEIKEEKVQGRGK